MLKIINSVALKNGEPKKMPYFELNENEMAHVAEFHFDANNDGKILFILSMNNPEIETLSFYNYGQTAETIANLEARKNFAKKSMKSSNKNPSDSAQDNLPAKSYFIAATTIFLLAIFGLISLVSLLL